MTAARPAGGDWEQQPEVIGKEATVSVHEITVRTIEATRGVSVREVVPSAPGIGELIEDGIAGVFGAGLKLTGAPVTVYHDLEFSPDHIDVEVVFPTGSVTEPLDTPAGRKLQPRRLPGGPAAVTVFVGPYERLAEPYEALGTWIAERGYRVAGPHQELYLSMPAEPGEPVTEVRISVAEA